MKKFLTYFILVCVVIYGLSLFAFPNFSVNIKNVLLASMYGREFCPRGDGKSFDDEILVEVNKNVALPFFYIPENLIEISTEVKTTKVVCIKEDILPYLKNMFNDAFTQNINLAVTSGFRSSETQSQLYKALIDLKGEKAKNRIAEPTHSEHLLGTTLDISGQSINYISASNVFDGTVEDLWLRQNAYKYGFVMSYPKNKTAVTGYDYEPWHYRFLGTEVARKVFDQGISIEEYFTSLKNKD